MIEPTNATMIDSREAYPIDECVAKMLGWMRGSERLYRIFLDDFGVPPDKLPHLYSLIYPLDKHLDQLKERARQELFDAADAYADAQDGTVEKDALSDIIDQKYIAINDCAELIKKAHFYKSEIRKELDKDDLSQLKIDHVERNEDGVELTYITLDSLDDWAKKYQVNIIDMPETIKEIISQPQIAPSVTLRKSQRDNALSIVLNDILRINPQATTAKVISVLRTLADEKHGVIISILDEGVKWIGDDGETQITSRDALGERIRYWRKHRLNQD